MANLRDIKRRIKSVKNTQQITKAMKMVAAAKVRKAQEAISSARPYSKKIEELVSRLNCGDSAEEDSEETINPLFTSREEKSAIVLLITSDKGLCGGFNGNVIRQVISFLEKKENCKISLQTVGKKGRDVLTAKGYSIDKEHVDMMRNFNYHKSTLISKELVNSFVTGETDSVYLVYNEFVSLITQRVTVRKILPFGKSEADKGNEEEMVCPDYIYEPSSKEILDSLFTKYIEVQLFTAMLESAAGEYGARMTAMDNATKNASEMIDSLTLSYNRARQANITRELIEIVSGADALA
jgi:F-type H+-transporting ATPase subunit gamma